jgi:hypothetical protein
MIRLLAAGVLAFGWVAQDEAALEKKVAELAKGLSDDELEARDAAAQSLTGLGPGALEALRKQAAASEGDVKARLLAVVKEIERRERMKDYLGGMTKVSLKAEKMALKDVVTELRKQARTKVVVVGSTKEELVTVEFADVPFFEALDRVCKAHGGVKFNLPGGSWNASSSDEQVSIVKGTPGKAPRLFKEQYVMELTSVALTEESDFQGAAKEEMRLEFRAMWEKGTRPIGAKLRVTALVDDKGNRYEEGLQKPNEHSNWQWVPMSWSVTAGKIPPADAKVFTEVAGVLELEFPSDIEVLKVEAPVGKVDVAVTGDSFSFTMKEMTRQGKTVKAKLESGPEADLWNREFKLFDKAGGSFRGNFNSSSSDGKKMSVEMTWTVPEAAEIVELRFSQPKPGGSKKVEFKFTDVRIR